VVRDVYNNIVLDDIAIKVVSYPKQVCATREAALHGFIRDMSLSQLNILHVSVFEDPFFAYVDVEINSPKPSKRLGLNLFKSKRYENEKKCLMVYVEEKEGRDFFFVNYKEVLASSKTPLLSRVH